MGMTVVRDLGTHTHVLNYATGDVMSFDIEDGQYLVDHWQDNPLTVPAEMVAMMGATTPTINSRLFRASLIDVGTVFKFPAIVNLETVRRCSERCRHCYVGQASLASRTPSVFETMTDIELGELFDELVLLGTMMVVVTGGEFFICKRAKQIIEMAFERGFVIEVFSNLQFLPPWFLKKGPLDQRVGRVQTSVYSVDPATHDRVTQRPGSMERTLRNLQVLQDYGFYVEVATPLMSLNYHTWRQTRDHFAASGINQDFSWPIFGTYYDEQVESPVELNITPEQFAEFVRHNPDFPLWTEFASRGDEPICAAGTAMFTIAGNSDVFPCSQYPMAVGNINQNLLTEVVHGEAMQRVAGFRCHQVGQNRACLFCLGNNWSETGNPFTQSPYTQAAIALAAQ